MKYFVVLFKNKERKKIINKFKTYERAKAFFNDLVKNNNVVFDKRVENAVGCKFEIGLLEKDSINFNSYFLRDDLGRQFKVELDDPEYKILEISPYKIEDLIHDVSNNKKISFDEFEKKYLKKGGLKLVSKINNRVVIQDDHLINLFSFKNEDEVERFLKILGDHMINEGRMDFLIVPDTSKEQKKYLYGLLEEKGISKSLLYRRFTTFPKK